MTVRLGESERGLEDHNEVEAIIMTLGKLDQGPGNQNESSESLGRLRKQHRGLGITVRLRISKRGSGNHNEIWRIRVKLDESRSRLADHANLSNAKPPPPSSASPRKGMGCIIHYLRKR